MLLLFVTQEKTLLLRELAILEAYHYKTQPDRDPVLCLHRKEADSEFMNSIANEIGTEVRLINLKELSVIAHSKLHFFPNPLNFFAYSRENSTVVTYQYNNSLETTYLWKERQLFVVGINYCRW